MKVRIRSDEPWPNPVVNPTSAAKGSPVGKELDLPVSSATVERWSRAEADYMRARREIEIALKGNEPKPSPLDDLRDTMLRMIGDTETQILELRGKLDTALSEAHKWHEAWFEQRDVTGESGLRSMERWWAACDALIAIVQHAREDPNIIREVGKLALRDMTLRERLHDAGFHRGNWKRIEQDSKP